MGSRRRIVICGGGVIGAAIAYFISRRGAEPIVIERNEVGGAASGKSGGFLALDWCAGAPLDPLARRSFALHAELAAELGNPWGYRGLTTYGGYAIEGEMATAHAGGRGSPRRSRSRAGSGRRSPPRWSSRTRSRPG
jgi:glycine/D-amino acid oxidase-like deaminating enzyme